MNNSFLSALLFLVGCGMALAFSWTQLAPVLTRYALIPSLLGAESRPLEFRCKTAECVTCLSGIKNTPQAIVVTGGSTFRYALKFDDFAQAMPWPVVNCIKNDSRMDAYRSLFKYAGLNTAGQVLFHGYNSWAVNSPGTWDGDLAPAFFVLDAYTAPYPPPAWLPAWARPADLRRQEIQLTVDQVLLFAHLFLVRQPTESMLEWRIWLRARYAFYAANDLNYWPLSKETHVKRHLELMQRWFRISAYVRSFIIDAYTQHPAAEISRRHRAFLAAIKPTDRVVFFPGPELSEVFPDRVKAVMAESRRAMLQTLAAIPGVHHVDIDYRGCGVQSSDFWLDAAMYFDVPHVNIDAAPKVTQCIVNALEAAGLQRILTEQ